MPIAFTGTRFLADAETRMPLPLWKGFCFRSIATSKARIAPTLVLLDLLAYSRTLETTLSRQERYGTQRRGIFGAPGATAALIRENVANACPTT